MCRTTELVPTVACEARNNILARKAWAGRTADDANDDMRGDSGDVGGNGFK